MSDVKVLHAIQVQRECAARCEEPPEWTKRVIAACYTPLNPGAALEGLGLKPSKKQCQAELVAAEREGRDPAQWALKRLAELKMA